MSYYIEENKPYSGIIETNYSRLKKTFQDELSDKLKIDMNKIII